MKKRKIISLLLTLVMVISLAGCSSSEKPTATKPTEATASPTDSAATEAPASEGTAIDFSEKPYTLKICYAVMSEAQPDLALIQEKLNEITLKELNCKVELEAVSLFNMANIYALKASSQEKMDLILLMPGSNYLTNFANSKLIQPMDDMLNKWGSDIKEVVGDQLKAGQFNGKQYGVPQKLAIKNAFGLNFLKSTLDKYNIDISKIKTYDDLDPIFKLVHENEPDMTIIYPESTGGNIAGIIGGNIDSLGNTFGVLVNGGLDDTKVVNLMETENYMNAAKKVREWYLKGYISKDVTTTQEAGTKLFEAGNVFSTAVGSINPQLGMIYPVEAKAVVLADPVMTTSDSQLFIWAVPTSSERPDKAVQFLNLMDSSVELATLMRFGIKGTHYEIDAKGAVDTSKNANWGNYWSMFGDESKYPLTQDQLNYSPDGTIEGYRQLQADWNAKTKLSKAYGFTFDPSSVKTEIAACEAVNNEYGAAIGNGTVDPQTEIPEFNKKLYAAGLQKIIDEKQRQLDAWLASK